MTNYYPSAAASRSYKVDLQTHTAQEYPDSAYSNRSTAHFQFQSSRRSRTPVQDAHSTSYPSRHSTEFAQSHRNIHHHPGYSYAPAVQPHGYATGQDYHGQDDFGRAPVQQMYQSPNSNRARSGSVSPIGITHSYHQTETLGPDFSTGLEAPIRKKSHKDKSRHTPATSQPYQNPLAYSGYDVSPRPQSSQNQYPSSPPSSHLYGGGSSRQLVHKTFQQPHLEAPQPLRQAFLPSPPSTPPMSRGYPSKQEPEIFDPRGLYGFDENDVAYRA
ncbi:unnamed protein product [Rhizoctonia solani]|uniref:Uncharacterized protein n=1 Tax=Rhizoctonia solani TaxID=456999 RepID=A0A8H3DPE5_9AGAM|nr:unnamed protein product [Rhizoctonia solani]